MGQEAQRYRPFVGTSKARGSKDFVEFSVVGLLSWNGTLMVPHEQRVG